MTLFLYSIVLFLNIIQTGNDLNSSFIAVFQNYFSLNITLCNFNNITSIVNGTGGIINFMILRFNDNSTYFIGNSFYNISSNCSCFYIYNISDSLSFENNSFINVSGLLYGGVYFILFIYFF
jgi:hypothetical protein